jgi:GDP-D-mannose 3', 5'-epimerase
MAHIVAEKEKAPAALCRKVFTNESSIDIIGDGEQTRSFLYIDDCLDAIALLMESDHKDPINIGSEEMVTINTLSKIVLKHSKKNLTFNYITGPQGVRGRNSDNTIIRSVLNWEPKYSLDSGIEKTYAWISDQLRCT